MDDRSQKCSIHLPAYVEQLVGQLDTLCFWTGIVRLTGLLQTLQFMHKHITKVSH